MELKEAREKISAIDSEMAALFEQRMEVVREVAKYKSERGLSVEDRERELDLLDSKSSIIEDRDIRSHYVNFLQSTMDISKNYQRRLMNGIRVACTADKYHDELAAKSIFPEGDIAYFDDLESAYRAAEDGSCDVAVMPLENSDRGEIGRAYDLIFSGNLHVNSINAIDRDGSTTRYAVLSRIAGSDRLDGDTETFMIMFTVNDEVGGLAKAINVISAYGYNMKVLRSRPMKDLPWHYYFYAELEGSVKADAEERLMRAIQAACPYAKIAGHYTEKSPAKAEVASK